MKKKIGAVKSKTQRQSSQHDQIWTKLQFWSKDSILFTRWVYFLASAVSSQRDFGLICNPYCNIGFSCLPMLSPLKTGHTIGLFPYFKPFANQGLDPVMFGHVVLASALQAII